MLKKNVLSLALLFLSILFMFFSCQTSTNNNELEKLEKENKELKILAKSALDAFKTPWERFLDGPDDLLPPIDDFPPPPPPPLTPCQKECIDARDTLEKTCRDDFLYNEDTKNIESFFICMKTAEYRFKRCFTKCFEED